MTWSTFYLICFGVGFTLSMISFLLGALHLHLPLKWHLPHGLGHHGGGATPALHGPAIHAGHGGQAAHAGPFGRSGVKVSPINSSMLMAFLAWFGGTGYLLTHYYRMWFLLGLGIATLSGLAAACLVSWFMVKVLLPHESSLQPSDYELVGMVARVNVPIRAGGTGEIIFSQAGTRRAAGARSDDGAALPKGAEVVITRYEKGIAYVRRWEDWTS